MKTSLKERKYVEMHVSILESGDGGTIKENIARGGIFMRDQEITELFWERKEQAVKAVSLRKGVPLMKKEDFLKLMDGKQGRC